MSKPQNFVYHRIYGEMWNFETTQRNPVLPFRLTGKSYHVGWDIPTCYAIDACGFCWMDDAHGPSLKLVEPNYLLDCIYLLLDRNRARQAMGLPLEKSEAEQLKECKEVIKRALDSSIPYVAAHNAFLISAESWSELCYIINPQMKKLEILFEKQRKGEKLTEEEIRKALA